MHNFISHLIGQFDLRHQFWEFVLLLSFFNYNNQIILEQQDTKISVTMINRPIKMVLPFFFFTIIIFTATKKTAFIIRYQRTQSTESSVSQSRVSEDYNLMSTRPCHPRPRICLPSVSEPVTVIPENQKWGSELSIFAQGFK